MDYAGIRHEADKQWHVVRVRANAERQVARSLSCRDIEVFLPLQKHPGKNKNGGVVERPLFPGYVFAGFNSRVTLPVVACPGVVHILCRGNIPEVVDPSEMFALQAVACRAHTLLPLPSFDCGEKVRIRQGPLADVEGIVLRDEGRSRLIVVRVAPAAFGSRRSRSGLAGESGAGSAGEPRSHDDEQSGNAFQGLADEFTIF